MDYIHYSRVLLEDGSALLQEDGVGRFIFTDEISEAQFLQWLRDQSSRITLMAQIKFGYQLAGLPAEGTLRFFDRIYKDESTDPPQPYAAVIEGSPTIERSIDIAKLGGRGTASLGSLTFANADGNLDYLLGYILDGRDVAFYLGDPTWELSQFRLVGVGSAAAPKADDDTKLTLALRDKNLLLDATIIGDAMTTGPNSGKPKPVILGQVYNFDLTPYLYDEAGPSYYFNNYAQDASLAFANVILRASGTSLINAGFSGTNSDITANATTNVISKATHGLLVNDVVRFSGTDPFAGLAQLTQYWVIADTFTAGTFKLSLERGGSAVDITGTTFSGTLAVSSRRYYIDAAAASVTLSSSPSGRVTADILAQGTSGDAAIQDVPHAGFRYIVDTYTRLTAADRNTAAFADLVAAQQASGARWGRAVLDRTNVLDILDEIAVATNSWYAWDRAGLLTAGKLDLVNLDSVISAGTITEDDMIGDPSYGPLPLPFGRLIVDANRNVVTQTDGLGDISAADRSKWSQQFQTRVKTTDPVGLQYLADWWAYHKTAIDSPPLETSYIGMGAQAFCDERSDLFAPFTMVFACTVGLDHYTIDPGQCYTVAYPRYGLSAGVKFRVVSVKMNPIDKTIALVLVRKNIPNWDALGVGIGVPDAPAIGTAVAGHLKAIVPFSVPFNGGASITGYTVTSSPGSHTGTGAASPVTVTGLTDGTAYTFTVTAANAIGNSSASAASNSVTPAAVAPDAPTSVSAAAASSTTATVTGTAPVDNGGSAVLDYTATSSPEGLTSTAGALPRTVTGLTPGVDYTFTLTARNAIGTGPASSPSNTLRTSNRPIALTISSNPTAGYVMFAAAGYPTDPVDVTVTCVGTFDLNTSFDGGLTFDTGSGWAPGSTLTLVTGTATILGKGASGVIGTKSYGNNGLPGLPAIYLRWPLTIDNTNGYIFAGGGSGASGGSAFADTYGGNSGAGAGYGTMGLNPASDGGRLTGGLGGAGTPGRSEDGANGGDTAQPGGDTGTATGGPAGKAIELNGHAVTWIGGNDTTHVKGAVS